MSENETKLLLADETGHTINDNKKDIDPGYVSMFKQPVMQICFAGERVFGFSSLCARISHVANKKYEKNEPSRAMTESLITMQSLIERQTANVHPLERQMLLREAVHHAKQVVHHGDFGFEIEIVDNIEHVETKEMPLPHNTLGIAFHQQQQQRQAPAIMPAGAMPMRRN